MEKKFNYVYITTNIINGKQYIGDHSCNTLEKDQYFGSGIYIINAINKYGKENFKREILEFFETKQEAFDAQERYIIQFNTLTPNGYNISYTGGHQCKNSISIETKQKISNTLKGRKGMPCSEKHKAYLKILHSGKNNPMYGKHLSDESKKKITEKTRNKVIKQETRKKLSIQSSGKNNGMYNKNCYNIWLKKYGKEIADIKLNEFKKKLKNYHIGKKMSEETKKKISESKLKSEKITCEYCNKSMNAGNYYRWHGNKCKLKNKI